MVGLCCALCGFWDYLPCLHFWWCYWLLRLIGLGFAFLVWPVASYGGSLFCDLLVSWMFCLWVL